SSPSSPTTLCLTRYGCLGILGASMSDAAKPDEKPGAMTFTEETPVTTEHSIPGLEFEATTGRMPLKNDQGEILAQVFYVAYTKKGAEPGTRPVTFTFNGGPGSPSIWLHMGAVGPFRTPMMPEGQLPPAPYTLEPNLESWLHFTDLVFI
ncbi:MAG TPA: peptidase S10, partial [Armatimonadetes bacterium]|nr:peptidase S10 [Armatimonadota bacterium]